MIAPSRLDCLNPSPPRGGSRNLAACLRAVYSRFIQGFANALSEFSWIRADVDEFSERSDFGEWCTDHGQAYTEVLV